MRKYIYYWKNNEKRKMLKDRKCFLIACGALNSVLIQFENGQKEITDRRALRRIQI